MKKVGLSITLVVLILALFSAAKLFLIGEPVDGNTVVCKVNDHENQVDIYVTSTESSIGFTDFQLYQEDTTLYISLRKVMASPLFDAEQSIYLEKCDLTKIVLGGKTVWVAD